MAEPTTVLGKRLRAARVSRGWTQQRLGELAGIPAKRCAVTISELETGQIVEPRRSRVEALADVLAVPVEWLYGVGSSVVPAGRRKAKRKEAA